MKKLRRIRLVLLLVTVGISIACMESINVTCSDGNTSIKKSNIRLMKTSQKRYDVNKAMMDKGDMILSFPNVSTKALSLVNEALNVQSDQFDVHYKKLSPEDKILLIKSSGQYNEDGTKLMLNVPEVTKRLIEVCFTDTYVREYIKSFFKSEDEE